MEKRIIVSIVVIILFVGLVFVFYIKQLLPIKINLTYAYVNEQNELTKVSQPLADELFIHPLEVKSIQHGGNLNIMIFTRESGFSEVEDGFFSCEKDTLVQVYIVNNESEEIKDILHVQELSGREYDVYVESKKGTMTIKKKLVGRKGFL